LRYSKVASIEKFPVTLVPGILEFASHKFSVVLKDRVQYSSNILNHYCFRLKLSDYSNSSGEQISLVVFAELLTRNGERWTGETARNQVNTFVRHRIKVPNILLDYVPPRPVTPKRGACMAINFDEGCVFYTGLLKSKRLPSGPSAKLQRCDLFHS
jgi:hypothetical protein